MVANEHVPVFECENVPTHNNLSWFIDGNATECAIINNRYVLLFPPNKSYLHACTHVVVRNFGI